MEWLSPAEIRETVQQAFDTGRPLDHVLAERLFGGVSKKPLYEKDWPPQARAAYYAAAAAWIEMKRADPRNAMGREADPPTVAQAHATLRKLAPDPREWWKLPYLTWPRIGHALGVTARTVQYHLCDVMGFVFEGRNSKRRITAAPCSSCGSIFHPSVLPLGTCPDCALTENL